MIFTFKILQEQQLLELKTLGVVNLTQAIFVAKKEIRTLPSAISSQTERIRTGKRIPSYILNELHSQIK